MGILKDTWFIILMLTVTVGFFILTYSSIISFVMAISLVLMAISLFVLGMLIGGKLMEKENSKEESK